MDREAWKALVHRVTKSWMGLSRAYVGYRLAGWRSGKESTFNVGDLSSIPESGR